MLSKEEILTQSRTTYKQNESLWRENALRNKVVYEKHRTSQQSLVYAGAGKTLLCIAFGASFEDKIDVIKKYRGNVDIICVDKACGALLENGITPDYVVIADAKIDYDRWCKSWVGKTDKIKLLANVTGNPLWAENWRGEIYYYVNKDNIGTQEVFGDLTGCRETIPASSNVGNTVVVFATQILGYDKYLLAGYDFCWGDEDNYYAFNDPDKRYWMKHMHLVDKMGRLVSTSNNLMFSARWLSDYKQILRQNNVRIFDCSGKGVLEFPTSDLETQLKISKQREITEVERRKIFNSRLQKVVIRANDDGREEKLKEALETLEIANISIEYIPKEAKEWLNLN